MKQSVTKFSDFLLEEQLPDTKGVVNKDPQAPASTLTDFMPITAKDHVTQVALERCHCVHLQEYLPHLLDLDLCKAKNHPRGWVVANPVHALHLESQLEDDSPPVSTTNSKQQPPLPLLYGEEQQRTLALSTHGVAEHWCPLDGRSAIIQEDMAIDKKEPVTTHHSRHPRKTAHSVTTANGGGTTLPASLHIPQASPLIKPSPFPSSSTDASASASRPIGSQTLGSTSLPAPVTIPLLPPPVVKSSTSSDGSPMQLQQPPPQSQVPPRPPLVPVPEGPLSSLIISTSPSSAANKPPPLVTSSTPAASTKVENVTSAAMRTTGSSSTHGPSAASTTTNDNLLAPPAPLLPDHRYNQLRVEEDKIRLIRKSLSGQRFKKKVGTTKKRKRETDIYKAPGLPGWRQPTTKEYTTQEQQDWSDAAIAARSKVELWMENFRVSRQSFLEERENSATTGGIASRPQTSSFFLPEEHDYSMRCCQLCTNQKPRRDKTNGDDDEKRVSKKKKPRAPLVGDELMQCLECSFIGCAPQSTAPKSKQHILRHLLLSGHTFGKYDGLSNLSSILVDCCPFAHMTSISIISRSCLLWRTRPTLLLQMRRLCHSSHIRTREEAIGSIRQGSMDGLEGAYGSTIV